MGLSLEILDSTLNGTSLIKIVRLTQQMASFYLSKFTDSNSGINLAIQ